MPLGEGARRPSFGWSAASSQVDAPPICSASTSDRACAGCAAGPQCRPRGGAPLAGEIGLCRSTGWQEVPPLCVLSSKRNPRSGELQVSLGRAASCGWPGDRSYLHWCNSRSTRTRRSSTDVDMLWIGSQRGTTCCVARPRVYLRSPRSSVRLSAERAHEVTRQCMRGQR